MGACWFWKGDLDIDIGDYEYHLDAWNRQDMLDYQIMVVNSSRGNRIGALITVKNGIPESSDPSYWLEDNSPSTIPEFYSLIKTLEKDTRDKYEKGNSSYSLKINYNTEYHYPISMVLIIDNYRTQPWTITLMPLEEGDLDIDIGDYENQLEAWNSQNMLYYRLEVHYTHGHYAYSSNGIMYIIYVENGIPDRNYLTPDISNKKTIPEIYSFIKEREETIRNGYNGINRSYLNVRYDTEYHYPVQISSGVGHFLGSYERWEITLTPLGGK
jgi:hypothetical protein